MWRDNVIHNDIVSLINDSEPLAESWKINKYRLHRWFHHGLSSQAFAFNLFGLMRTRKDFSPLLSVLSVRGIQFDTQSLSLEFEFGERHVFNEKQGVPTTFDAVLQNGLNEKLFIEVKLSEAGFGGCSVFCRGECSGLNPFLSSLSNCYLYSEKKRDYWNVFLNLGIQSVGSVYGVYCPFAYHYQFYRELMYALEEGGVFLIVFDDRNVHFHGLSDSCAGYGVLSRVLSTLPPEVRSRIVGLSVQELVAAIEQSEVHADWINIFKEKYALV